MADLPIEDHIELKDSLDRLIRNKRDAIQVMIYMTLKWKLNQHEIAGEIARLKLKMRDRIIIVKPS